MFAGSADWMPRNLDRRVEILFPLLQEDVKEKAYSILKVQMSDTLKAHILKPDDTYEKIDKRGKQSLCAQDFFCKEAQEESQEEPMQKVSRVFVPQLHQDEE